MNIQLNRVYIGLFVCLFAIVNFQQAFAEFTVDRGSFGAIYDARTNSIIGSAFIAGNKKNIITAAHVVQKGQRYVYSSNSGNVTPLELKYTLPRYDLAVLKATKDLKAPPIPFGDIRRLRPGDSIIYLGWNKKKKSFVISKATVSAIGSAINQNVVIEFIEFQGVGVPGYSGGPVFDAHGNAIGME